MRVRNCGQASQMLQKGKLEKFDEGMSEQGDGRGGGGSAGRSYLSLLAKVRGNGKADKAACKALFS